MYRTRLFIIEKCFFVFFFADFNVSLYKKMGPKYNYGVPKNVLSHISFYFVAIESYF